LSLISFFHTAISQEETDRFVSHLFDKDPSTTQPDTLPLPYNSDNPPPSVRIIILLLTFYHVINTFLWCVIQDLYPDREIDVALSDEDNIGSNELVDDDAGGNGAHSIETLAPNPIGTAQWGKPALQLPIRLLPPLHQAVIKRKVALCLGPSASKPKLRLIR
jgi:hypothetical protein